MINRWISLSAALILSGCSGYHLEALRHAEPKGSEFSQSLAMRYLDYAEAEARAYHWADSARFAEKGLLAAYDSEVGPEAISDYPITEPMVPVFEKSRADLLAALTDKNRKERPAVAADALFYFDCWLDRESESAAKDDITYCRERFVDRIEELNDTSYEKILKEAGEPVAEVDTTSYIVFFDWGQAVVTQAGGLVIDGVLQTLEARTDYEIILNGHTDTAGDAKYNMQLSKRRAEAVKTYMVEGGAEAARIQIFAYGESDPRIKTADGTNEPANRRVEIFLGE